MSAKEEHFVLFKKLFLPLRFQTKDSSKSVVVIYHYFSANEA